MTDFKHGALIPIDKAPKDGTIVVIYHAMYIDAKNTIRDKERPDFYAIAHWDGKTWKESFGDEYATYPEATHFIPLPPTHQRTYDKNRHEGIAKTFDLSCK